MLTVAALNWWWCRKKGGEKGKREEKGIKQ
jgi:hypothetical protein